MAWFGRGTRLASALAVVALGVLGAPGIAVAHAALESTSPADGAMVAAPVSEITFTFSEAVTPTDDGFEVLDPQGQVRDPEVVTDDDTVFVLRLDPPLAGGTAAVKYEVTSGDGHVIEGNITFEISAAPPTEPTQPPATEPPATEPAAPAPTEPPATGSTAEPVTSVADEPAAPAPTEPPPPTGSTAEPVTSAADEGGSGSNVPVLLVVGVIAVAVIGFVAVRGTAASRR